MFRQICESARDCDFTAIAVPPSAVEASGGLVRLLSQPLNVWGSELSTSATKGDIALLAFLVGIPVAALAISAAAEWVSHVFSPKF